MTPMVQPSTSIKVDGIVIHGNDRTRLGYFVNQLRVCQLPAFVKDQPDDKDANIDTNPKTIQDTQLALARFHERLQNSGLFEHVDTKMKLRSVGNGEQMVADVDVFVRERGQTTLSAGTNVESGVGTQVVGSIKGLLRNPVGFGEVAELTSDTRSNGEHALVAQLQLPNIGPQYSSVKLSARMSNDDYHIYSSFAQQLTSFSTEFISPNGKHGVSIDCSLRDEVPMMKREALRTSLDTIRQSFASTSKAFHGASLTNVESDSRTVMNGRVASNATLHTLGSSLKTSLRHKWTLIDTRDSAACPSEGVLLQHELEVAMPPGTVSYIKTDVSAQVHRTLTQTKAGTPGLQLSLVGNIGLMAPLSFIPFVNRNEDNSHRFSASLTDRFQLGGPMSLRGFDYYGVGPRAPPVIPDLNSTPLHTPTISRPVSADFQFDQVYESDEASKTIDARMRSLRLILGKTGIAGAQGTVVQDEKNYGDALGGLSRTSFLAMLSAPLPIKSMMQSNGRAFCFLNAGSIGGSQIWSKNIDATSILGQLRMSVGTGVSLGLFDNALRLEASYSLPLLHAKHDVLAPAQFGVGVNLN